MVCARGETLRTHKLCVCVCVCLGVRGKEGGMVRYGTVRYGMVRHGSVQEMKTDGMSDEETKNSPCITCVYVERHCTALPE